MKCAMACLNCIFLQKFYMFYEYLQTFELINKSSVNVKCDPIQTKCLNSNNYYQCLPLGFLYCNFILNCPSLANIKFQLCSIILIIYIEKKSESLLFSYILNSLKKVKFLYICIFVLQNCSFANVLLNVNFWHHFRPKKQYKRS